MSYCLLNNDSNSLFIYSNRWKKLLSVSTVWITFAYMHLTKFKGYPRPYTLRMKIQWKRRNFLATNIILCHLICQKLFFSAAKITEDWKCHLFNVAILKVLPLIAITFIEIQTNSIVAVNIDNLTKVKASKKDEKINKFTQFNCSLKSYQFYVAIATILYLFLFHGTVKT